MTQLAQWRPRVTHPAPGRSTSRRPRRPRPTCSPRSGSPSTGDGMLETPRRMAAGLRRDAHRRPSSTSPPSPTPRGTTSWSLVEDIPVRSLCEHHMLPFVGVAHVGYLPGDRILGLSKFARLVDFFARRPQTQERLTKQIAEHLPAPARPARRRGRDRGRAHLHEPARRTRRRRPHRHLRAARHPARRPRRRAEFLALHADGGTGTTDTIVIVGGGLAAGKAVERAARAGLRRPHRPVRRGGAPALRAAAAVEGLPARQRGAATASSSMPPSGTPTTTSTSASAPRSTAIDPARRRSCAPPSDQPYDQLLLATGARPRQLAMADDSGAPVAYLRTIDDSDALSSALRAGRRVVDHRGRLDRAGGRLRGPRAPAPTSPSWSRSTCRWCGSSARRSPASSPTCTATTASTCALVPRSTAI